jgi:hypothetical protein
MRPSFDYAVLEMPLDSNQDPIQWDAPSGTVLPLRSTDDRPQTLRLLAAHAHPLKLNEGASAARRCDACGARPLQNTCICAACDFDCCFRCVDRLKAQAALAASRSQ